MSDLPWFPSESTDLIGPIKPSTGSHGSHGSAAAAGRQTGNCACAAPGDERSYLHVLGTEPICGRRAGRSTETIRRALLDELRRLRDRAEPDAAGDPGARLRDLLDRRITELEDQR